MKIQEAHLVHQVNLHACFEWSKLAIWGLSWAEWCSAMCTFCWVFAFWTPPLLERPERSSSTSHGNHLSFPSLLRRLPYLYHASTLQVAWLSRAWWPFDVPPALCPARTPEPGANLSECLRPAAPFEPAARPQRHLMLERVSIYLDGWEGKSSCSSYYMDATGNSNS